MTTLLALVWTSCWHFGVLWIVMAEVRLVVVLVMVMRRGLLCMVWRWWWRCLVVMMRWLVIRTCGQRRHRQRVRIHVQPMDARRESTLIVVPSSAPWLPVGISLASASSSAAAVHHSSTSHAMIVSTVGARSQLIVVVVQHHLGAVIMWPLVHDQRCDSTLARIVYVLRRCIVSLRVVRLLVAKNLSHHHSVLVNQDARRLVLATARHVISIARGLATTLIRRLWRK